MKLIDFDRPWSKSGIYWIDILKFKHKTLFEFCFEECQYTSLPCILVQIGPTDLFQLIIGLHRWNFSFAIWSNHYGY